MVCFWRFADHRGARADRQLLTHIGNTSPRRYATESKRPFADERRALLHFKLPSLAGMLFRVVFLRLREIARRVLHELSLGVLVTEAVGLSVEGRVD